MDHDYATRDRRRHGAKWETDDGNPVPQTVGGVQVSPVAEINERVREKTAPDHLQVCVVKIW